MILSVAVMISVCVVTQMTMFQFRYEKLIYQIECYIAEQPILRPAL